MMSETADDSKIPWRKIAKIYGFVVLVSILVAAPLGFLERKGRYQRFSQTKTLSNAKQVALAVKIYAIDHDGRYPATLDELEEGEYLPSEAGLLTKLREPKSPAQEGPIQYLTPGAIEAELAPDTPILRVPWKDDRWIQVTADYAGSVVPRTPDE